MSERPKTIVGKLTVGLKCEADNVSPRFMAMEQYIEWLQRASFVLGYRAAIPDSEMADEEIEKLIPADTVIRILSGMKDES